MQFRTSGDPEAAGLELTRLRAAIEALATGNYGDDVITLFGFIRSMIEESAGAGFRRWLSGDLGVELERRTEGGITFRAVTETPDRLAEIFVVPFPHLHFEDAATLAEQAPQLIGSAFILVERDVVSISPVRYLAEDEEAVLSERQVRRSGIVPADPGAGSYDPDATIIAVPSTDLLHRAGRHVPRRKIS